MVPWSPPHAIEAAEVRHASAAPCLTSTDRQPVVWWLSATWAIKLHVSNPGSRLALANTPAKELSCYVVRPLASMPLYE